MHYEHLVAVNDPDNPFVITRGQLWQGLLLRAEEPQTFNPHIETVTILERDTAQLLREIDFGKLQVRDRIRLTHQQIIHFDTEPGQNHAGGQLTIRVEEPEADFLLVRFSYDIPTPDDPEAVELSAYLHEMWRQMDVECIRMIRSMAEDGRFDTELH